MTYAEKLRDPRWQKKRLRVMERDNFTCRDCGDSKKPLTVHHCHYSKGEPWVTPDLLLLTLCNGCHVARQAGERALKEEFAYLLANLPPDQFQPLYDRFQKLPEDLVNGVSIREQCDAEYDESVKWYIGLSDLGLKDVYDKIEGRQPLCESDTKEAAGA